MFSLNAMEKPNARVRKPTSRFMKLTQATARKGLRDNLKLLEIKTDVIRTFRFNGADKYTVANQFKEWLKLHDWYYKNYDNYCSSLTDLERKNYEDKCSINNDWLADIKTLIEGWFESNEKCPPIIPVKPDEKKEGKNVSEVPVKSNGISKEIEKTQGHKENSLASETKKKMEKIHVAPLSSKSIPALFAVPNTDTSGNTSMRLCKRVIYIKNGISYSNYVPVTQNEADSKNMFGVQRIVNVLDEKHQFKRHMVIKNWVNHVKPAKGNISAIPAKSPILTRPTPQIVQNTVSTSMPEKAKRKVTLPNKSIIVTYNPASTQQPGKKISPVMLIPVNKVSTPQTDLKQSNLAQTNTVIKTENNIPVMQSTAKSNIQISSVYSLSDSNVERKSKEETAAPVTLLDSSINDLKNSPQKKQTLGDIVSELNRNLSRQTYTADKSSPSNVYLLMAHNGKKCLIQAKAPSNLMTHIETSSNQNEESVEILNSQSKSKSKKKKSKKSEHKKNRKRKSKTKRSYSPDNSSDSDYMPEAASFQMLKGIDCEQVENKIVRKNKVLKVKLSKIPSLTNLKREEDSETESTSEGDGMGAWNNVVVKEEPLDPSDDSDTNGYLNSFLKEQQLTMDTIVDQPDQNMQFPLVMIKKEPVSDNEDTIEHEPGPSKRKPEEELPILGMKIKEEPISDEDTYESNQATESNKSQCLTRVEEPAGVCTSREDRVKQLKERIKEKQTVLAAFRKRPRISLVDGM